MEHLVKIEESTICTRRGLLNSLFLVSYVADMHVEGMIKPHPFDGYSSREDRNSSKVVRPDRVP